MTPRERQIERVLAEFTAMEKRARCDYGGTSGWWICPWCRSRNAVAPALARRATCAGCGAGGS